MKKFLLFLVFLFFFLYVQDAQAQRVELSLHIERTTVEEGQSIYGKLTTKLYDSCPANFYVDFGDGSPMLRFQCPFNEDAPEGFTICEKGFVHVYEAADSYFLLVYSCRGGMGMPPAMAKIIRVTERTTPTTVTGIPPLLIATSIEEVVQTVTNIIYWLGASIAIIMLLLGGFYVLTSAGDPKRVTKGRQIILYTIIGLAIITFTRGIIELIYAIIGVRR